MRKFFYPTLALDGIRKNKRLYVPYILTCIGMIMMHYIMNFLACSNFTDIMYGVDTVREMFLWGSIVIAIFSCIFLFYTNSFLMKNRKKEFGLYNVLGMGKSNIGRVLFWENMIIALISLIIGLAAGILLSKMTELFILNLIKGEITYAFEIPLPAVINVLKVYSVIFLLLFLNGLRQIKFSSAVSLLRSGNTGEKPLKANWIVGILGAILLGLGYFIAVSIEDPLSALMWFFIAVILVIIGTYFVMIFGSVFLCKLLQKNKNFYYKKSHFVSVSSMAYRMKRNGAGLASICILVTMILVIVSTTTSLYFGVDDVLENRFPKQMHTEYRMIYADDMTKDNFDKIDAHLKEEIEKNNAEITDICSKGYAQFSANIEDNSLSLEKSAEMPKQIFVISIDDFNRYSSKERHLDNDEVFLVNIYGNKYDEDTIKLEDGSEYKVKSILDTEENPIFTPMMIEGMTIIVPEFEKFAYELETASKSETASEVQFRYEHDFNTNLEKEEQKALISMLVENLYEDTEEDCRYFSMYAEGRAQMEGDIYALYGGLLGLGIIMSIIFSFAAVLIIYYKQITEGYEDQSRFEIMQKVGMTKKEIKKSINSQLLIVFFLPICFAGIHLAFAFPMIRLILKMFFLTNVKLFALTTIGCFGIFTVLYAIIYKVTSNAYYKIVSGAKAD